jgi:hypothetical protein
MPAIVRAWFHTSTPGAVYRSEPSPQSVTPHAVIVNSGTLQRRDDVNADCQALQLVRVEVLA